MSGEKIMEILRGLDPGSVAAAGASYRAAASALEILAERIARHTRTLSEHWDGTAADAAVACLCHSREQALNVAAQAKRTGAALTWLGGGVLPVFRSLPDPAGQPDAHALACRYLASLEDYLTVAARALPLSQTSRPPRRGYGPGLDANLGGPRAPLTCAGGLRCRTWISTDAAGSGPARRRGPPSGTRGTASTTVRGGAAARTGGWWPRWPGSHQGGHLTSGAVRALTRSGWPAVAGRSPPSTSPRWQ